MAMFNAHIKKRFVRSTLVFVALFVGYLAFDYWIMDAALRLHWNHSTHLKPQNALAIAGNYRDGDSLRHNYSLELRTNGCYAAIHYRGLDVSGWDGQWLLDGNIVRLKPSHDGFSIKDMTVVWWQRHWILVRSEYFAEFLRHGPTRFNHFERVEKSSTIVLPLEQ
jgi:hypothetical protein